MVAVGWACQSEVMANDDEIPSAQKVATEQLILANERTFLAWIRTSLALVVTGLAIITFEVPLREELRVAAAFAFLALGIMAAVQAWLGWRNADAAIAAGEELPAPRLRTVITAGVVLAVLIAVVGVLLA